MKNILLNDGNAIPAIGFGVYMIPDDGSTYNAVSYTHLFDSSANRKKASTKSGSISCIIAPQEMSFA